MKIIVRIRPKEKEKKNEDKTKWTDEGSEYTKEEKRKILAKVIEIGVRTILENHVYKFGYKIYRQVIGGPMGLKLTGIVARLVMDRWARKFEFKLAEAGIKLDLLKKYIDDVNLVLSSIDVNLQWKKEDGKWTLVRRTEGGRIREDNTYSERETHTMELLNI